jgi:nucleotide-binding universal stress UspA family protein
MSESATETGLLVCVDGSPASDAAVAWATREAVMRQLPITLLHVVEQIAVGWPVGQMFSETPQWQKRPHSASSIRPTRFSALA